MTNIDNNCVILVLNDYSTEKYKQYKTLVHE